MMKECNTFVLKTARKIKLCFLVFLFVFCYLDVKSAGRTYCNDASYGIRNGTEEGNVRRTGGGARTYLRSATNVIKKITIETLDGTDSLTDSFLVSLQHNTTFFTVFAG